MEVSKTKLDGVLLLRPKVFGDDRGFFYESYNERVAAECGIDFRFVQDNQSRSRKNVLRGLHYQIGQPQGKLVRAIVGEIFDVAVDLRRGSGTFGKWLGQILSAENKEMLWIPPGFAHGYVVVSEWAEVLYKATDYYAPQLERSIRWDDPDLAIEWPHQSELTLSAKDQQGQWFRDAEMYSADLQVAR
jgi:dTDP-4-dehydrorhamnose 3,5-epimerase